MQDSWHFTDKTFKCQQCLKTALSQYFYQSSSCVFMFLTWPISTKLSEVVQHETEETGKLNREEKKHEMFIRNFGNRNMDVLTGETVCTEGTPAAGLARRRIQWTGRCSRCTCVSSPDGPCSADTTSGSKPLLLSLQKYGTFCHFYRLQNMHRSQNCPLRSKKGFWTTPHTVSQFDLERWVLLRARPGVLTASSTEKNTSQVSMRN